MTNKEKYAKEILSVALEHDVVAVTCKERIVMGCSQMEDCRGCLFYGSATSSCKQLFRKWANAEYKEPKIFTDREIKFVKLFPLIKYIARNEDGNLFMFASKPVKGDSKWRSEDGYGWWIQDFMCLNFNSIQWDDEEPTSREEILKEEK